MDKEMIEQFQMLLQGMSAMEDRLNQKIKDAVQESETHVMVYMENQVSRRIDALTDGYKLTHEKQYDLERELDKLKLRLDRLEERAG